MPTSLGFVIVVNIDKLILKCIWKCRGPPLAKTMSKKQKVLGLILLDFRTLYKAIVIMTFWKTNSRTKQFRKRHTFMKSIDFFF